MPDDVVKEQHTMDTMAADVGDNDTQEDTKKDPHEPEEPVPTNEADVIEELEGLKDKELTDDELDDLKVVSSTDAATAAKHAKCDSEITDKDRAALAELKEYMAARFPNHPLDAAHIGPGGDFKLTRFLRAKNHRVAKTAVLLTEYISWRHDWGVDRLNISHVADTIQKFNFIPMGASRFGHETLYMDYNFKDLPPDLDCVVALVYFFEHMDVSLAESLLPMMWVCDLGNFSLKGFNSKLEKAFMTIMDNSYPERMGPCLILRANVVFRMVWRVLRPAVPEKWRDMITMVGKNNAGIEHYFEKDALIKCCGGTRPDDHSAYVAQCYEADGIEPGSTAPAPIDRRVITQFYGSSMRAESYAAVRKGFCSKRTRLGRWNKYFMVLTDDGTLWYFKSRRSTMPNNAIALRYTTSAAGAEAKAVTRSHVMAVTDTRRPYYFSFATDNERDAWLEAIEGVMAEL